MKLEKLGLESGGCGRGGVARVGCAPLNPASKNISFFINFAVKLQTLIVNKLFSMYAFDLSANLEAWNMQFHPQIKAGWCLLSRILLLFTFY